MIVVDDQQQTINQSSLVVAAIAVILTFVVVYKQVRYLTYWSSRGVKGPTPWPFMGTNVYYLFKNRVQVDQEFREKYGHVYGVYEGAEPVLRVTDTELLKLIYIKQFQDFTNRDSKRVYGFIRTWVFFSTGKHWTNQRVLITPMFTSNKMKQMFNVMLKCAERFTDEVDSRISSSSKSSTTNDYLSKEACEEEEKIVNLSKDELMASSLDLIAQTFFSLKFDTYKDKTSEFFKRAYAFSTFNLRWFLTWLFIPSQICKYMGWNIVTPAQYEYFVKLSESLMKKRRQQTNVAAASGENNKAPQVLRYNDLIEALMEAYVPEEPTSEKIFNELDDNDAHFNDNMKHTDLEHDHAKQAESVRFRRFDDKEILAQMTFFFMAGFETTSSTLSFCFYELARQQQVQQELYDELKGLMKLQTTNTQLNNDDITYYDLIELKKLNAFIAETLRIHPVLLENNRAVTAKGGLTLTTSSGHAIYLPENSIISIPSLVIQRDPDYWNEPFRFDMSRFYPENRDKIASCSYLPFGLGPRNCAGMRFALLNIKTLLARTLIRYKVLPHNKEKMNTYPPEYNRHAFFLQLKETNFKLMPRGQAD